MISSTMLATHLVAIYRDTTSTVGDLLAVAGGSNFYDLPVSKESQIIEYTQKALALLDKKPLDETTSIRSLLLDDDGFIEAELHERKLHTNLNFAIAYANEV